MGFLLGFFPGWRGPARREPIQELRRLVAAVARMIAPSCTGTSGRRGPVIKAPTPSHRSNLLVVPCLGLGSGWLVSGDWWEGKVGAGAGAGAANKGRGLVVVCNN